MFGFVVLLAMIGAVHSQMVRQCTCQEFQPCKNKLAGNFMQCADQCQSHVSALGGSYPAIRSCLQAKEPMIKGVIDCQSNELSGACARGPGQTVPKRYPETLKIAAFSEINSMLSRSGIQAEARTFLAAGKKFSSCLMRCIDRSGGNCFKKLNCGLALPPDNVLVQQAKRCAISRGFNTQGIQQLCNCMAGAGIRGLAPLCPRIQIS